MRRSLFRVRRIRICRPHILRLRQINLAAKGGLVTVSLSSSRSDPLGSQEFVLVFRHHIDFIIVLDHEELSLS